jgi:excisionase family DNA binding protein
MGDVGKHAMALLRALLGHAQAVNAVAGDEVLTTKDVADMLKTRESEVLKAIDRGELKATRIGSKYRVTRQNVSNWLNG